MAPDGQGMACTRCLMRQTLEDSKPPPFYNHPWVCMHRTPEHVVVCTSNVDSMFKRARFPTSTVCKIHGNVHSWQCAGVPNPDRRACPKLLLAPPCNSQIHSPPANAMRLVDPECRAVADPPRCLDGCGGLLRPNVYMFGDGNMWVQNEAACKVLMLCAPPCLYVCHMHHIRTILGLLQSQSQAHNLAHTRYKHHAHIPQPSTYPRQASPKPPPHPFSGASPTPYPTPFLRPEASPIHS